MPTQAEILEQQRIDNQSKIQAEIDKREAANQENTRVATEQQAETDASTSAIFQQNSQSTLDSSTAAATQLEQDNLRAEERRTMAINPETGLPVQASAALIEERAQIASGGVGNEGGAPNLSPRGTPGSPTGPTTPTDTTPTQPAPSADEPTEPVVGTPTDEITDTQGTPSSTTVSQTTRETLDQSKDAPLDTLGQRGLTQEVVKLEIGEDEIVADPTAFNVAPPTDPALDLDNLATAGVPNVPEAEQAVAQAAVIAKDYELSLLSPEEMGQNLERLRNEEPMQAADMTLEIDKLLDGMENGEIPLWAKPAVTLVEQQLAARGLSASSIGRDALFNAIIQSAMPIAQQNASFKQDANKTNYNAKITAIFSDVAAENAAKQFNASSINQKNQFMTNLQANLDSQTAARRDAVSQFNAAEKNKIAVVGFQAEVSTQQFNAAQANQAAQFVDSMDAQRAQFNSQQTAAITQSNVNWRRQTNQINTALENQVNQTNTQNAFNLSQQATSFLWQEERDEAHWAFQATENDKQRRNTLEATVLANEAIAAGKKGSWVANLTDGFGLIDTLNDFLS